ncbi:MAG TPA: hypothetical protein VEC01_06695 [Noviherbaspirillum sp.]|uniref:hypothetical protein n=1 Tax=Noviherbaspirillum sp. TaxID=1926288 RepID=UPI002D54ABDB|nr:hypothetical protein [Noviherbaspirillum sp.]HYD94996.1 hypothetical protein [Noviherbaspirillum sp.]
MPGPLGDPVEPLPIVPDPGDVGLVLAPRPDAPLPLLPDAPLDIPVLGQSTFAPAEPELAAALEVPLAPGGQSTPAAAAPCVREDPVVLAPDEAPPTLELLVEPLPPDDGGVFGSTELPEPVVRELMPDVEGVAVCAADMPGAPAVASSASNSVLKDSVFMFPP